MPDYLELFDQRAPWTRAAASVQVFKVSTQFLGGASDEILRHFFVDLRRRNILLAWAGLMLTATSVCGNGIEGYADTNTIKIITERIRLLGGELHYVAMDEPFWFGHFSDLPNACHESIADLAGEIAGKVAIIKRFFPDAQIGDVEGLGTRTPPNWVDELMHWIDAYRIAVGEPLAFFHSDVLWEGPWRDQLDELVPRLKSRGIKFGMIYNGDPDDQSNLEWSNKAADRFATVESEPTRAPDHAILQTWLAYPTHMLPETEPGTMTWLVHRYVATESKLTARRDNGHLAGTLTDSAGRPLAGATLSVFARKTGASGAAPVHVRTGTTPTGAVEALFGIRINTECNCSGSTDAAIGPLLYRDDRTGKTVRRVLQPADPLGFVHFRAVAGHPMLQNTSGFPVIEGSPFTFEVPIRETVESQNAGYAALIFRDASGRGIVRVRAPLEPVKVPVGSITTNARGGYAFPLTSATIGSNAGFEIEYSGSQQYRSTTYTLR